jgi:tetratricopeptide (TPR) repeat protein
MTAPSLLDRLKHARIVQVLFVCLGASWVVLQMVDTLVGLLSLPDWVGPVAVLLLVIGLVVVLATAWIQSLPSTKAAEEAGQVPSDWQVAPGDAVASLLSGRIPHLTWGRAILGGAVALSLLFGAAGLYVVATGGAGLIGPTEAGADEAATGIAVVPFHVTGGEELNLWREGMVDVLSANLDGMGGYRTIDARTVMARWRERVGDEETPDLETSLTVAGNTGARFGLVGSMVGSSGDVRLNADVYDLASGDKVTQTYVEGSADSVLAVVGRLTVELTRELLASTGQQLMQAPRTAGITTTSLDALRAYLDGEAAFRQSDFPTAAAAFERAVDADSTFAMAWRRLSDSYGWMENINSEEGGKASRRVVELADRLPIRERTLMVAAERALDEGDLSALGDLREIVSKYPDDPEGWHTLGEFYRHVGTPAGLSTEADELEVFEKAVSLDPTFTPYYIHYIEALVGQGRGLDAREALATYDDLAPGIASPHLSLGVDLFGGDEAARAAALAGLDTVPEDILVRTFREMPWRALNDPEASVEVARAAYAASGYPVFLSNIASIYVGRGKLVAAAAEVTDPAVSPFVKVSLATDLLHLGLPLPGTLQVALDDLDVCPDREDAGAACMFMVGAAAAFAGDQTVWQAWVDRNRGLAIRFDEEGSGSHARQHDAIADALEAFWILEHEGDEGDAVEKLSGAALRLDGSMGYYIRWHLAELQGQESPRRALETLEGLASGLGEGYAQIRIGTVRERLGDDAGALRAYGRAADVFAGADDGHPYAGQAREGVARLGG